MKQLQQKIKQCPEVQTLLHRVCDYSQKLTDFKDLQDTLASIKNRVNATSLLKQVKFDLSCPLMQELFYYFIRYLQNQETFASAEYFNDLISTDIGYIKSLLPKVQPQGY